MIVEGRELIINSTFINEQDLKIQPYRINCGIVDRIKGVRITHKQMGIIVNCDENRSLQSNMDQSIYQLEKILTYENY